ncbi:MAG: hypothetical protein KY464_18510, partial [Gemmatimonadetes bacterium]|nr:hypothetical protein [Gemmatimonadota bacterium]
MVSLVVGLTPTPEGKPGHADSHKFNTAEIPFTSGRQTIRLATEDFSVAEWWVHHRRIPPGLSHPQFDNVVALEVSTGTG